MTDQELLDELQRAVIENPDLGATWPSTLWTTAEVIGYVNQRQDRMLKETLAVTSWLRTPLNPQNAEQDLPDGWLATRNAFLEYQGATVPLSPVSRREADLMEPGWSYDYGKPQWYIEEELATRQLSLVPAPAVGGVLNVYAALVGAVVDGSGLQLTVPDEFVPYLFYGVLSDMFGKQGRAYDAPRQQYCEARYTEGVELGRTLLQAVVIS